MKKESRIRRALKDKSNWSSLVILSFALASAIYSFFVPDDKFSGKALSLAVGMITLEFFVLIVVHLEGIQTTIAKPKNTQLSEWDINVIGQMIDEAKDELFFSGCALTKLGSVMGKIKALPTNVKIRLLVMEVTDNEANQKHVAVFGRPPAALSLSHLNELSKRKNVEIRTTRTPLIFHVDARDYSHDSQYDSKQIGRMQVGVCRYNEDGDSEGEYALCVNLTPTDSEWDKIRKQIAMRWELATVWKPTK